MHDISTGYGDDGGDVCAETYKTSNTTNTAALADRPTAAAAAERVGYHSKNKNNDLAVRIIII